MRRHNRHEAGLLDEEAERTLLPDAPVVAGRRHAVQLLDVSVHPSGMLFPPVKSKGIALMSFIGLAMLGLILR